MEEIVKTESDALKIFLESEENRKGAEEQAAHADIHHPLRQLSCRRVHRLLTKLNVFHVANASDKHVPFGIALEVWYEEQFYEAFVTDVDYVVYVFLILCRWQRAINLIRPVPLNPFKERCDVTNNLAALWDFHTLFWSEKSHHLISSECLSLNKLSIQVYRNIVGTNNYHVANVVSQSSDSSHYHVCTIVE